ncbi:MAG: phosphatase PAP2 family protein, partial [Actinomycetota bacterium]|nr:phosphatase PAP2 family protein [Actinomycetota bacterium]
RVDQAAMDGAQFGRTRLWQIAEPVLEIVSIPALGFVLVAAMTLAVLRRRWMLALQIAVLVVGANLSTQVLKYYVFDRPDLDVTYALPNALPSGHTTAAASVAVAAVLVVPPRARPYVAVLGGAYAGLTGVSTLIGQWHRPSDVVAALFVVLAWCGIATAMSALGRRAEPRSGARAPVRSDAGAAQPAEPGEPARQARPGTPGRRFSTATLVVITSGYLLAAITGAAAWTALNETRNAGSLDGRTELLTAYAGGALGVLATTGAVFATILVLRVMARPRGISA